LALGVNCVSLSAIDFSSMSNAQNEHEKTFIDNLANQTIVSDPVFPELTEPRALKCLA